MQLLIDADGCPVVDLSIRLASEYNIKPILLCDDAHVFNKPGATTMSVSIGADSVDFALVNLVKKGDIVLTQDYGLAAMCLAKNAFVLNQNGLVYTSDNIDTLLESRHSAKKARRAGHRIKGPSKRTSAQDDAFCASLKVLMQQALSLSD